MLATPNILELMLSVTSLAENCVAWNFYGDVISYMKQRIYQLICYLEVITWLFSYLPIYQARASKTAEA